MRDASVQQSIKSHQFFGEIDSVVAFAGVFSGVCGERLVGLLFPVAAAFLLRGGGSCGLRAESAATVSRKSCVAGRFARIIRRSLRI